MFNRILIANRGEIARRIQSTCRRLGIETVAVYSDADADAGFVAGADQAVHIGASPPAASYLNQTQIIAAALNSGAQAVHPGYGFLAENAVFARAVAAAGLTFIGPAADTIALMGSKIASKRAMEDAGVACVPGYHGDDQDDATLAAQAQRIGFPVLIKASAGGGGKGMRVVHEAGALLAACAAARREAQSAFGDQRLLLEKFVTRPRHIEVQVFGDDDGNIVHLYERECSIQRRYQKIVEEAPSAFVDANLRERITATAVRAAQAVGYRNAGTVEFIVTEDGEFFFMEMNTRLQVEHSVTEQVCGVDLVEWQLRVASGEGLPVRQDDLRIDGHAIEVRVYAEDPWQGFLPSTGTVERFSCSRRGGLRVDADLAAGRAISMFYDPMIAKFTMHGATRAAATARLVHAIERCVLTGPTTNLTLLARILRHPDFVAARIDTGYLDRHLPDLLADDGVPVAAYAAALLSDLPPLAGVWGADGWQSNQQSERRCSYRAAGAPARVCRVRGQDPDYAFGLEAGDDPLGAADTAALSPLRRGRERLIFRLGERQHRARVRRYGALRKVELDGQVYDLVAAPLYAVKRDSSADAGHPGAPMPGRIVRVFVAPGDAVSKGQPLVVLEGMKMEFTVTARVDGIVEAVLFAEGDQVDAEVPLVDLTIGDA